MANEVIVFPDAEALIVTYLNAAFPSFTGHTSLKAYGRIPNPRPAEFVRILRTGGTSSLVVDQVTFVAESWAAKPVDAFNIATRVRGLIKAIDTVSSVQFYKPLEFSGPANLPDPESGQERYTQTFSVGVRGSAL